MGDYVRKGKKRNTELKKVYSLWGIIKCVSTMSWYFISPFWFRYLLFQPSRNFPPLRLDKSIFFSIPSFICPTLLRLAIAISISLITFNQKALNTNLIIWTLTFLKPYFANFHRSRLYLNLGCRANLRVWRQKTKLKLSDRWEKKKTAKETAQ